MFKKADPHQEGIDSYLSLLYASPIHALANNSNKFGKEERFIFTKGYWYAHDFLNK